MTMENFKELLTLFQWCLLYFWLTKYLSYLGRFLFYTKKVVIYIFTIDWAFINFPDYNKKSSKVCESRVSNMFRYSCGCTTDVFYFHETLFCYCFKIIRPEQIIVSKISSLLSVTCSFIKDIIKSDCNEFFSQIRC